jgi:hypothetical protein
MWWPMKSLADGLPADIARQIHPDWRKNESAYRIVRNQLLGQYQGQWIGFADGSVIAAGSTPLQVFLAIKHSDRHPFVVRVGHEDEPWYRIRRTSFGETKNAFAEHKGPVMIRLMDRAGRVLATAQMTIASDHLGGTIDLRGAPIDVRELFAEFEEIVSGQMFGFLDDVQTKIDALGVVALFADGRRVPIKELQVFPSTQAVSFEFADVSASSLKSA